MSLRLALSIPLADIMAFRKVCLWPSGLALGGCKYQSRCHELLAPGLIAQKQECLTITVYEADVAAAQVCKAYFALLEVLCQSHQGAIATCDGNTFGLLVTSLDYGLKSLDVSVSSQCAAAVDNLASYYFRHAVAADAPSPTGQACN